MAVTETKTIGYGSRLKNSFGGIWTGFIMFVAGTCLLWWNEGNAVHNAQAIAEGRANVEELADISKINPSDDGKLIHATGEAVTNEQLNDADFGITVNAIKLERKVEYYQFVEHSSTTSEDKLGGKEVQTTTYDCRAEWTDAPVSSADFHGSNAKDFKNRVILTKTLDSNEQVASNVTFGAYKLNESQIADMYGKVDTELKLNDQILKAYNSAITSFVETPEMQKAAAEAEKAAAAVAKNDSATTEVKDTIPVSPVYKYVHVSGNTVYFGENPNSPQIGDMRVSFSQVNPGTISIIAQVDYNTFKAYKAKKGGKTVSLVSNGRKSAEEMFDNQESMDTMWLWVLRIIGILVVCGGLKGIFDILSTILKVVPFLAGIMNWGVGLICNIVGVAWSLIVIAIAWLFYRPILAICLLVIAGAGIAAFAYRGKIKQVVQEKMNAQK